MYEDKPPVQKIYVQAYNKQQAHVHYTPYIATPALCWQIVRLLENKSRRTFCILFLVLFHFRILRSVINGAIAIHIMYGRT